VSVRKKDSRFHSKQAVKFVLRDINITEDGFATFGRCHEAGVFFLYEEINLKSYPSCKDFLGRKTAVRVGDVGTIIRYIGRPEKVSINPTWFQYDIYETLINGNICQVFRHNLTPIRKIKE